VRGAWYGVGLGGLHSRGGGRRSTARCIGGGPCCVLGHGTKNLLVDEIYSMFCCMFWEKKGEKGGKKGGER
jgi:hypothetical protein